MVAGSQRIAGNGGPKREYGLPTVAELKAAEARSPSALGSCAAIELGSKIPSTGDA